MTTGKARYLPLLLLLGALLPGRADAAATLAEARLWQERFQWDGLLQARARAARISADPALLKVVELIAHQVAQQSANLKQIQSYVKAQSSNVRYAFSQQDPGPSLTVIQNNLHTLAKGTVQVRNNLYFLTTRVRMSGSQALPDPKLSQLAKLLIAQIQSVQLTLNTLYTDTVAVHGIIMADTWAVNEFFRYSSIHLLRSVVQVQDSVFAIYNASYELYVLSKQ